jgi:hypothetical protein
MHTTPEHEAVERLQDRTEITDLVFRLGVCLDEGRFGEMGALFSDDATATTPGGTAQGRETIVALAQRNHRPDFVSQHVSTNLLVQLAGDRATVRGNLVVQIAPPRSADAPIPPTPPLAPTLGFTLGEVYRIECVRTPGGWRFASVTTVPVWQAGERPFRPAA